MKLDTSRNPTIARKLIRGGQHLIIRNKKCWELTQAQKDEYIQNLTSKLAALRAHADISQEDLANIIGTSRQTYYAIENRKRTMSWSTYLSLIFFYDTVENTSQMIRELGVYPMQLVERFNDVTAI